MLLGEIFGQRTNATKSATATKKVRYIFVVVKGGEERNIAITWTGRTFPTMVYMRKRRFQKGACVCAAYREESVFKHGGGGFGMHLCRRSATGELDYIVYERERCVCRFNGREWYGTKSLRGVYI